MVSPFDLPLLWAKVRKEIERLEQATTPYTGSHMMGDIGQLTALEWVLKEAGEPTPAELRAAAKTREEAAAARLAACKCVERFDDIGPVCDGYMDPDWRPARYDAAGMPCEDCRHVPGCHEHIPARGGSEDF